MKNHRMGMKYRIRRLLAEMRRDHSPEHFRWAEDELMKLADREDIFIMFSDTPKVGLNPKTVFTTPAGIYTYPLKEIMDAYKLFLQETQGKGMWAEFTKSDVIPFASHRKYIHVLQSREGVFDVTDYDVSWLHDEIQHLNNMFYYGRLNDESVKHIADVAMSSITAQKSPMGALFVACNEMADFVMDREAQNNNKQRKLTWVLNGFLRSLGYTAISDRTGTGTIYSNEPFQAFFLSKKYVKHLMTLENKSKMPKGIELGIGDWSPNQRHEAIQKNWKFILQIPNPTPSEQLWALENALEDLKSELFNRPTNARMGYKKVFVELFELSNKLMKEFMKTIPNLFPEVKSTIKKDIEKNMKEIRNLKDLISKEKN